MFLFCKKGTFFFIYLSESADSRQIVIAVFHRSYLVEQHGLDAVLEAFFEDEDFPESFGLTYQEALYAAKMSFK